MTNPVGTLAKGAGAARADDATVSLLRMFYAAQVYAVETFTLMLDTYQGLTEAQRRKLDACRRLERRVAGWLNDHLSVDLKLAVNAPRRARQAAEILASLRHGSWADRMAELEGVAIRGVTCFRSLKALYGEREPTLCARLLAKEMALRDFARDELDGLEEESLDRILALLGPEDCVAVSA
jgi:hypothetical protein